MNTQRESLADYVRRIRVQVRRISLAEVERNSGGGIDASYVNRIENGFVTNVSPDKLDALARGLTVPPEEVIAVATGRAGNDGLTTDEIRLLHCYRHIPPERQVDALTYVGMLFERYGTTPGPDQIGELPLLRGAAGTPKGVPAENLIENRNGGGRKKSPAKKPGKPKK
ncbi:MAG TPA: helix-turn-helix transcriptional regulator [Pyrinomonadaceae bacterium]